MTITIADGRGALWQWDTGRRVKITDGADVKQIHYQNRCFGCSVDVDVENDGTAIIPDELLQDYHTLTAYAYVTDDTGAYTMVQQDFAVYKRAKPADYVFTPVEQITLSELVERLDKIEEAQDPEAIKNVVDDYLAQNPVEIPVQSVNGQTGAVELTAEDVGAIADETDPTVPEWAKQPEKPTYTAAEVGALPDTYTPPNQTAQQVGADPAGTAASAVSQHNTDATSHNDLRLALKGLSDRINVVLDSDDATLDQMSEVVAYIKSNKSMIDAITTSKVNVSDIVNNLTTNISNKPLSAAQGVALNELIDSLSNSMTAYRTAAAQDVIDSGKVDKVTGKGLSSNDYTDAAKAKVDALATVATSGSYDDLTNKPTIPAPVTEQTVSGWGFTKNTGTYSKPTGGIPKTDLANDVQASLGKADTALQEHQSLAAYRTAAAQDIIDNGKQDKITSTNKLAYSLISGTPTIPIVPTNVSAFTNDAGYLTLATLPKYEGVVE